MFTRLILFTLSCAYAFLTPSVKLDSGKTASVIGQGPPLLLSTGLFGTIPRFFYSELVNDLKNNLTIVTINGIDPIRKHDIEQVAQSLQVDKLAYLSHSSYFPEVLTSQYIKSAVLLDPINLPQLSFEGMNQPTSDVSFPTLIIRASKLYEGQKSLPDWQDPIFNGNVEEEMYEGVGHPDILNDFWANVANDMGIWDTARGETTTFENWRFKERSGIPEMRKTYRKYVGQKIKDFVNQE